MSDLIRKTVIMPTGRTTFKLEPEFWQALGEAAAERKVCRSEMVRLIVAGRRGNAASMLRVWCLKEALARAAAAVEDTHLLAAEIEALRGEP